AVAQARPRFRRRRRELRSARHAGDSGGQEGALSRAVHRARRGVGVALRDRASREHRAPDEGGRIQVRLGQGDAAVRASDRSHRAHARRPDGALSVRHRVRTARSSARAGRSVRRHRRQRRRHAAALLLPLRSDDRPVRRRDHAHAPDCRRVHRRPHRGVSPRDVPPREAGAGALAMWSGTPLFPEAASTMAPRVDALYFFLLGIAGFFSILIAGLIVYFAIKYRRRSPREIGRKSHASTALEVAWTVIPLMITMVIFVWGARIFFAISTPPPETLNIYAVGKQWMWKFQHLDGQREINELHV